MDRSRHFTLKQRTAITRRDGVCLMCGTDGEQDGPDGRPNKLEADHIVPWANGGPTTIENGQALCRICNNRKSNKDQNTIRLDYYREEHFKTKKAVRA